MAFKDKFGVPTDLGQDWKGLFYLSGPVIFNMDDGMERTVLISLWFLVMAVISWATRGSGIAPSEGAEIRDKSLDLSDEEVEERLNRNR